MTSNGGVDVVVRREKGKKRKESHTVAAGADVVALREKTMHPEGGHCARASRLHGGGVVVRRRRAEGGGMRVR